MEFSQIVCQLKLKYVLWFAAVIGNMQFLGMEGGLTHIQGFL